MKSLFFFSFFFKNNMLTYPTPFPLQNERKKERKVLFKITLKVGNTLPKSGPACYASGVETVISVLFETTPSLVSLNDFVKI